MIASICTWNEWSGKAINCNNTLFRLYASDCHEAETSAFLHEDVDERLLVGLHLLLHRHELEELVERHAVVGLVHRHHRRQVQRLLL